MRKENESHDPIFELELSRGMRTYINFLNEVDHKPIRALRGSGFSMWAFPSTFDEIMLIEALHKSIHENRPVSYQFFEDPEYWVVTFPGAYVEWLESNSFEKILEHVVVFFATWHLHDETKSHLAFDQSPKFLHDRIQSLAKELDEFVESMGWKNIGEMEFEEAETLKNLIFDKIVFGVPPWLDIRNLGNVENVCENWSLYGSRYEMHHGDILHFKKEGKFTPYSEWDESALNYFTQKSKYRNFWPKFNVTKVENEGNIYLISDGANYKIGYSKKCPLERVAELQTGNPKKLFLVTQKRGTKDDEACIHRSLSHKRLTGEWFNLNSDEIELIFGKSQFHKKPS